MEHIASLSYGKDSIAMLEVIKEYDMPLDRIVHVEIFAYGVNDVAGVKGVFLFFNEVLEGFSCHLCCVNDVICQ